MAQMSLPLENFW